MLNILILSSNLFPSFLDVVTLIVFIYYKGYVESLEMIKHTEYSILVGLL